MSRVGKLPVAVPKDVQVEMTDKEIVIKGKLGVLKTPITSDVKVTFRKAGEGNAEEESSTDTDRICVEPANDSKFSRAMWGTVRSNVKNMVTGVTTGFTTKLEITGVGFRAAADAKLLTLSLGFAHEIKYAIPAGISIKCEKPTLVAVSGFDKQLLGQVCSEIMKYRPVEPYKGKGVYKEGSYVRRKEGKKK